MELDGEIGIFQQVASQDQDYRFTGLHETLLPQFFQACQSDGGSWFAANTVSADFGFGFRDFKLGYLFDLSAGGLKHSQGFLPRGGIANADGGGLSVGNHRFEL